MTIVDNAYALVVGIANYHHINKLPTTVLQDAQDIYKLLISEQHCGYQPNNVQLLLDHQATNEALRQALVSLAGHSNPDSTVFIYLSCHGGQTETEPYAGEYLLPVDTVLSSDQLLTQTAISGEEFTAALKTIPARKMVVVFDCCHAGGIGQPKDTTASVMKSGLSEDYYTKLTTGRGRVILASSRHNEVSWIMPGDENSLFTKHLLAGLRGNAPGPGGVIRIFDLFDYIQPRVTSDQPDQHPIFKAEIEENFSLALYLGGKTPIQSPLAPLDDAFNYDVFISYRQQEPDKTWARKTLVPRLKAEGLRVCIDYTCFRLGRPLILEMARAVEESRYTLAILSPAYLKSNFTELENVLAEHLGLEQGQYRLLTAIREDCIPRLGMRANLMLDMTEDDEFDSNLARLVFQIRKSPDK